MQHPLSDEELQLVSQAVTDCTHIMKNLDIEGEGPESDCYKLLAQWSEQSGGDRAKLIDVLYSCDYAQVAELLWKRYYGGCHTVGHLIMMSLWFQESSV